MTNEEYAEWAKTRKTFYVEHCHIKMADGYIFMDVRMGDHNIKVGDVMGGAKVLRIQSYGRDLEEAGGGLTCRLTMSRMPGLYVEETDPDNAKWLEEVRNGQTNNADV